LSKKPENIEQLTELEEYLTSLTATLNTLQGCIAEMMSNFSILDRFKHKLEFDLGSQMWHVFAAPTKIADRCVEVTESNVSIKRRFKDEMMGEQVNFTKSMVGRRQLFTSYL
jgi:dynein heavy chain